jgi:tetratricopeptide (TPR) repeat protein
LYEANDYRVALDGGDGVVGLLEVADSYSGTKAGNLAHYYAADAYFQLGEYEQALTFFQRYAHAEDALGAGAYAGEAAINENMGNFAEAGDRYREAALVFENEFTSARYLESAGRNYEAAGDFDDAREVYELIKERFPESTQAQNVEMYMARVEVLENKG